MAVNVKDIVLMPIQPTVANNFIRQHHYSKRVVPNSQFHFGAFYNGILHGVMSFGPSMRKDLIRSLVRDTEWNGFLELNRMAFDDFLPKNSESRCIAIAIRLIKKHYPHIRWIVSFADATQCGDGAIYRASGFVLTSIKSNSQIRLDPETGEPIQSMAAFHKKKAKDFSKWKKLEGYQLRYIYFIDKTARDKLTTPILPFSDIDRAGAGMYLGKKKTSVASLPAKTSTDQVEEGRAALTATLHLTGAAYA